MVLEEMSGTYTAHSPPELSRLSLLTPELLYRHGSGPSSKDGFLTKFVGSTQIEVVDDEALAVVEEGSVVVEVTSIVVEKVSVEEVPAAEDSVVVDSAKAKDSVFMVVAV